MLHFCSYMNVIFGEIWLRDCAPFLTKAASGEWQALAYGNLMAGAALMTNLPKIYKRARLACRSPATTADIAFNGA